MHGLVLLPSDKDTKQIIDLQRVIISSMPNLEPVLGLENNCPHLTLLQGIFNFNNICYKKFPFNKGNELEIIKEISESINQKIINNSRDDSNNTPYLSLNIKDFEITKDGWIFLNLENNQEANNKNLSILDLHNHAFKELKPFIVKPQDKNKDFSHYSSQEQCYYLKYGYRYIKECYRPHITLGKIKDIWKIGHIKKEVSSFLKERNFKEVGFGRIGYFQLGVLGNCKKKVFTLPCYQ